MNRIFFSFLPFIIQFLFFLIILPIIINSLGEKDYKILALTLYIPLLIPVLTYGFTQFIISNIGLSDNKRGNATKVINIAINKTIYLSIPSLCIFFYLLNDFNLSFLLTLILCVSLINEFFQSILLAFDKFLISRKVKIIEYLINFLLFYYFREELTLFNCVYILICSHLICFIVYIYIIFNKLYLSKIEIKLLDTNDISLVKKSKFYFISTLSGFVLFNIDVYILAIYSEPKDFIVFQLLLKLNEMGRSVVGQIPAAFYSKFIILHNKDKQEFRKLFKKLFLFIVISIVIFSPIILNFISEIFYYWQKINLENIHLIFFYLFFLFNLIVLIDSVPSTVINSTNNNKNSARLSMILALFKIFSLLIFIDSDNIYLLGVISIFCIVLNLSYNLFKTRKILIEHE